VAARILEPHRHAGFKARSVTTPEILHLSWSLARASPRAAENINAQWVAFSLPFILFPWLADIFRRPLQQTLGHHLHEVDGDLRHRDRDDWIALHNLPVNRRNLP